MIPIAKYDYWLTDDGLMLLKAWARDGLSMTDIAQKKMHINRDTLFEWKKRFPAISDALLRGKEPVDVEVENALHKRALGYDYEETVTEIYKDADGKERQHIKKYKRHMPADTTAMKYWLTCRKPEQWLERKDISIETRTDADYRNMHTIAALINAPAPDIDISEVITDE